MNIPDQSDRSSQWSLFPREKGSAVRLWTIVTIASVIFLTRPAPAHAAQVRIPLTIDYLTLREALKHKLYTAPGGRAQLWNGLDDCQFLYAENPEFARAIRAAPRP